MRHRRKLHRRERRLRNKKIIIMSICLICIMSVGYAAFQTQISLSAKGNVLEKTFTISELKDSVVTSGDGLYSDSTEEGRYVYKGTSDGVNNYIEIQETDSSTALYRIISIESDGTLKIIRNKSLGDMVFDPGYSTSISGVTSASSTDGTRIGSSSYYTDYCVYDASILIYPGCNVWGSKTTMLDSSGNNVTKMPREYGSTTTYDLPEKEAYINTYLNSTWYNTLSNTFKSKISNHIFNVGEVEDSTADIATILTQEKSYKWKGNVGLMNITDYTKATLSSDDNWFYEIIGKYSWTINPFNDDVGAVNIWVEYHGELYESNEECAVFPVLYLSSDITLEGSGTLELPYEIVS